MRRLVMCLCASLLGALPLANTAQADPANGDPWGVWAPLGKCETGKNSISLELRQDFNSFDTIACPTLQSLFQEQGAKVSLTFDELAHRTSASADGVAALLFRHYFSGDEGITGLAIGPYVQFDGTQQFQSSTSPSQITDTVTAGGVAQIGINNAFGWGEDNFRLRAGEVQGSSGITSNTVVGEWIPYYPFSRDQFQFSPVIIRAIPEIMVQYDSLVSGPKKYLLFAQDSFALRIGPQIQFRFWVHADSDSILSKMLLTLVYHPSVEVYTGRGLSWAQATLSYNLTTNFAISASYGYGNSETTGNNTSQAKLGLALKF
jgi:hypothetical protein